MEHEHRRHLLVISVLYVLQHSDETLLGTFVCSKMPSQIVRPACATAAIVRVKLDSIRNRQILESDTPPPSNVLHPPFRPPDLRRRAVLFNHGNLAYTGANAILASSTVPLRQLRPTRSTPKFAVYCTGFFLFLRIATGGTYPLG